jgi:ribosomal protein S18 acetylase RimI-like enzyme
MPILRNATQQDLPVLLDDLMPGYYEHDRLEFSRDRMEPALRELLQDPKLGRLWMIEERSQVVGYLALVFSFSLECYGREAYVDELYILPAHRGRGLGSQALKEVIGVCPELDIRLLRLEVTQHNQSAKDLYLRLGFEDHGRSSLMFPNPR